MALRSGPQTTESDLDGPHSSLCVVHAAGATRAGKPGQHALIKLPTPKGLSWEHGTTFSLADEGTLIVDSEDYLLDQIADLNARTETTSMGGEVVAVKTITVSANYCFGENPLRLSNLAKVNFIFAPNGSGKTTISNALANLGLS